MATVENYPLHWPEGWPRSPSRRRSVFKVNGDEARRRLLKQLKLLGGSDPIISTNMPIRKDGVPYSAYRTIVDPGVALYFTRGKDRQVIACDHYDNIGDNIHAIGLTIDALRAMNRHGASSILDRAFKGFVALPPAGPPWWEVLGISSAASVEEVDSAGRKKMLETHPDRGGSNEAFQAVKAALAKFRAERGL